jgi:hypothetical protein
MRLREKLAFNRERREAIMVGPSRNSQQAWERARSRVTERVGDVVNFIAENTLPLFWDHTVPGGGGPSKTFIDEVGFWKDSSSLGLSSVWLKGFTLSDWFPRAPGVYWSGSAVKHRAEQVFGITDDPELGKIYSPLLKLTLVETGGIGTIRLLPRRIDNTDVWFATAVKGPECAGGIPIAVPNSFLKDSKVVWGDSVSICGEVRFLRDAGLEDVAASVHHASPVIIFAEKIEGSAKRKLRENPVILTPVVLFDRMKDGFQILPEVNQFGDFGYTFVHCNAGSKEELDRAAYWVERYATKHHGRIITNYDQLSPILADAPLSYQRLVKKNYDRTIIEHLYLHGTKIADRIDHIKEVHTEYINYGQVGAIGDNARAYNNRFTNR